MMVVWPNGNVRCRHARRPAPKLIGMALSDRLIITKNIKRLTLVIDWCHK
jgi:hypothetical protein